MKKLLLLPLVAGSLLVSSAAGAQDAAPSKTTGFLLGAHLNASSLNISPDEGEDETYSGGGLGFTIGYGFSNLLTLYLNVDGAALEDDGDEFTLGQADLGARFSFGGGARRLVPYLDVALSGISAQDEIETGEGDVDIELRGGAFTFGGGLEYFFSPRFALDAGLKISVGSFTEAEIDGETIDDLDDNTATTARINIGVSFRP